MEYVKKLKKKKLKLKVFRLNNNDLPETNQRLSLKNVLKKSKFKRKKKRDLKMVFNILAIKG